MLCDVYPWVTYELRRLQYFYICHDGKDAFCFYVFNTLCAHSRNYKTNDKDVT